MPRFMTPDVAISPKRHAIRASFLDFKGIVEQPKDIDAQVRFIDDGLMLIEHGKIAWLGSWQDGQALLKGVIVTDYSGYWIIPGFIDSHVHYAQTEMIGAHGEQLLTWLEKYTFPVEMKYGDKAYAVQNAQFFIEQLLSHGTTTALVFCTVHPESVDALFESAQQYDMRLIAGKVMMDRHAPPALCDTAESSYSDTKALIEKWHGQGRLLYAITPRFAPTSTPEQLQAAGRLRQEFPDVYMQTHLSENLEEIAWVKQLFTEQADYLAVYHHYGLTGARCVFAHGIHLEPAEWQCLAETQSSLAFCPTSNLFIGSGLFRLQEAWQHHVKVGMGTDVGGGTSLSLLTTLNEAYKVMQLQDYNLSAYEAFYLATLGGACALGLEDKIGNFTIGHEADFIVLDLAATPLQQFRQQHTHDIAEKLFALIILGDERNIAATYVHGQNVYAR